MAIMYEIKDKDGDLLFPELTTYQLIDKHKILFGIECNDISEITKNFAADGFIVEKIIK